jgi:hypothetical protein
LWWQDGEHTTVRGASADWDFYGIWYFLRVPISKTERIPVFQISQVVENKDSIKWFFDCNQISASDVPAAGFRSCQPREEQTPGKSNRQRSGPGEEKSLPGEFADWPGGEPPATGYAGGQ